jgi:hypothetical protein
VTRTKLSGAMPRTLNHTPIRIAFWRRAETP